MKLAKIESGLRIVLDYVAAFNRRDITGMMAGMSDDCIYESSSPAPNGTAYQGKKVLQSYWQEYFSKHGILRLQTEQIFGLGFHCVLQWKLTCQDSAGNAQSKRGVELFQFKDEKICVQYSYEKSNEQDQGT
jgi:ketosteroid isomerase-like protein